MSDAAVPARESDGLPSPQLTMIEETVPSGSLVEKLTLTGWPARAGFGETPVTLVIGGLSLTVTETRTCPVEPLLSVAVTVMV